MQTIQKNRFIIVVIIIVLAVVFVFANKHTKGPAVYKNDKIGVTLTYPARFTIQEKVIKNDPYVPGIILTSGQDKIAIAVSKLGDVQAQIEKGYYNSILFADAAGRMRNSVISIAGFDGFKTLFDFTKSQYFIYKDTTGTSTLALQVELNAGSADKLLELENTLREILTSTTVR
jgi:hypothetical protein